MTMPHAPTARLPEHDTSPDALAASAPIEPGLLGVFRIFLLLVIGLIALRLSATTSANPGLSVAPSPWHGIVGVTLLFGYLCSSRLQRELGRLYLPLAIVLFVAPAMLSGVTAMKLRMAAGLPPAEVARNAWVLIVLLIVPLVLVAWQYGFRWALAYCALTALIDIALALPLLHRGGPTLSSLVSIAVVRTVVLLPVGYAVARLMDVQRRQRAELAEANVRLARYAATLEGVAAERERSRLSHELHDTLAHGLSSLAVQLEAMGALWSTQPERARAMLDDALTVTRTALSDSRRAIKALRARPLDDMGLAPALRQLAESAASRHGLALALTLPATVDGLSSDAEHAVYRIASEALSNIVRHARARRLTMSLVVDAPQIQLTIADDGCGFDTSLRADDGHFGLYGMHERARAIGAELVVASKPGEGTTLRLTTRSER